MKYIKEQIKTGKFSPIYLIYGAEGYLVQQTKNLLCQALVDIDDGINYTRYEGKQADVAAIASVAETMPFFQDRRLILLEDTGFLKKASDEYLNILKNLPDTTVIVMVEQEVDKRSKIYKYIKEHGYISECTAPDEKQLMTWCAGLLAKRGKKIRQNDLAYFLSVTSNDMNQLRNELDKLADYAGEREVVSRADIDEIVTVEITNQIFDMISAMASGNQKKAMAYYDHLLALKEPPMRILFLIARQFQLMLVTKDMKTLGKSSKEMGSAAGLSPYIAEKYAKQAEAFKKSELISHLEECALTEEKVKTGQWIDRIAVEILIIKFSKR